MIIIDCKKTNVNFQGITAELTTESLTLVQRENLQKEKLRNLPPMALPKFLNPLANLAECSIGVTRAVASLSAVSLDPGEDKD